MNGSYFTNLSCATGRTATGWALHVKGNKHSGGCYFEAIDLEGESGGCLRIDGTTTIVSVHHLWTELDGGVCQPSLAQDGILIENASHAKITECYVSAGANTDGSIPGAATNRALRLLNAFNCHIEANAIHARRDFHTVARITLDGNSQDNFIGYNRQLVGSPNAAPPIVVETNGKPNTVIGQVTVTEGAAHPPVAEPNWLAGDEWRNTVFDLNRPARGYREERTGAWLAPHITEVQSVVRSFEDVVDVWDAMVGVQLDQTKTLVQSWTGAGPRGAVLVAPSGAEPDFVATDINGRPGIRGDGVGKHLVGTLGTELGDFTIYFLFRAGQVSPSTSTTLASFGTSDPEFFLNGGFLAASFDRGIQQFNQFFEITTLAQGVVYVVSFGRRVDLDQTNRSILRCAADSMGVNGVFGGMSFETHGVSDTRLSPVFTLLSGGPGATSFGSHSLQLVTLHRTYHSNADRTLIRNLLKLRGGI